MGDVVATFVVKDGAIPTPHPVEGVDIYVFDNSDTLITHLVTDNTGSADYMLAGSASPGTRYIIRLKPIPGSTVSNGSTQTVMVIDPLTGTQTNIFDFTVLPPSALPVATDPDMCRLSGYFTDPGLRPLKNVSLIFHPREGYPKFNIAILV